MRALDAFQQAVAKEPGNPKAHYSLGGIYNLMNRLPEAEQEFKATLKIDPTYVDAIYSLGFTYELMGDKEKAQPYYDKYNKLKQKWNEVLQK